MPSADIAFVVFAFTLAILLALLIHGIAREARQRSEEEVNAFLQDHPELAEEIERKL